MMTITTTSKPQQLFSRKVLFLGVLGLTFLADYALKQWIQASFSLFETRPVWPWLFQLTYVHNTGAAFSLGQAHPQLLLLLSGSIFAGLLLYACRSPLNKPFEPLAVGLILGGAAGNLLDRLSQGYVIDYIELTLFRYPVFNWADTAICTGVALLVGLSIYDLLGPGRRPGQC